MNIDFCPIMPYKNINGMKISLRSDYLHNKQKPHVSNVYGYACGCEINLSHIKCITYNTIKDYDH